MSFESDEGRNFVVKKKKKKSKRPVYTCYVGAPSGWCSIIDREIRVPVLSKEMIQQLVVEATAPPLLIIFAHQFKTTGNYALVRPSVRFLLLIVALDSIQFTARLQALTCISFCNFYNDATKRICNFFFMIFIQSHFLCIHNLAIEDTGHWHFAQTFCPDGHLFAILVLSRL